MFHSRTNCGYVALGKCNEHPHIFTAGQTVVILHLVSVRSILICFTAGLIVAMLLWVSVTSILMYSQQDKKWLCNFV